ncbi:Radical SAM superfamily enzyme YgiQ, UPF0313 family [Malonomonas rubra DSM 5091]|uniref:Radical SAM superfamily enzyme YgiQ, UPF0313 family n=1 Tax=Malonomonas rubra DSM 5091 TaxID=1122189 RepID=A0A1M6HZP0_MALRU|nr:radical SAM protein [Malonomonas rubra]SHJ27643.1 Radical SAM superfamily enzyme YgiQ, UPF0313 family [Malonomonas rubra DSM 5091]
MRISLPTLHVRPSAQAVPLAAGNLKACLPEKQQPQTVLVNLFPEQSIEEMCATILAETPDLVAFSLYLWNRQQVSELCHLLRQKRPGIKLVAGGPEASADAVNVLKEAGLDGIICGEGEEVFSELVATMTKGNNCDHIPGFLSAAHSSATASAAVCSDLEKLPSPWLTGTLTLEPGCGVLWEVARGCRFNCAFCYDAKGHQGVRPLPVERLRSELQLFTEKQVGQVWILDSTFNAPAERGKQLLRMLLEYAPQIHYHLEAKADFLDSETAALLGQLSCSVQIGLQSAQADVLKPLHRNLDRKQMQRALQMLSEYSVTYGLDLIYGLPGDTHQGFCSSLDFALQLQPNQVDIFPLAVLPGTELHQKKSAFGLHADNRPPYLITANSSYSPEELEKTAKLATATDIFYNRGRAVGFFLQLCETFSLSPVELLQTFTDWLQEQQQLSPEQKTDAELWQSGDILCLQQQFIAQLLNKKKLAKLQPLAEDLLNYHFCCAELILAENCRPATKVPANKQLLKQKWLLNPAVKIQHFNYELEELEAFGGDPLPRLFRKLAESANYGIFLQQNGELIAEGLQDEFARLLLRADGNTQTADLLRGFPREEGVELLGFAVAQGILLSVN